jgi:hypothetical protein
MDTYTIVPRSGSYRVVATAADGKQVVVATYPTEQEAISRLKYLQEKAGAPQAPHRPQAWRI